MDGPGAPLSPWGATANVVVRGVPAEGAPVADVDRGAPPHDARASPARSPRRRSAPRPDAMRYGPRRPASAAATSRASSPSCRSPPRGRSPTPSSTGGRSRDLVPTLLDPREVLGGAARERRLRLAVGPQRHGDLPDERARPRAVRGRRRAPAVRRADPRARLPRHRVREAARRDADGAASRGRSAPTPPSARRSRRGTRTPTRCSPSARSSARGSRRSPIVAETNGGLDRPRPRGREHRERRERGRAGGRRGRPSGSVGADDAGPRRASRSRRGRTWAPPSRPATAGSRRCRHDRRPLREPVLRRARRRGGRRATSRSGSTARRARAAGWARAGWPSTSRSRAATTTSASTRRPRSRTLLGWLDELAPDVLVCGPAFGSGRYGYACGVLAREAGRRGIPVVTRDDARQPGRARGRGRRRTSCRRASSVAGMRTVLPVVAGLAARLAAGEPLGTRRGRGVPAARAAARTSAPTGRARRARSTSRSAELARRDPHRGRAERRRRAAAAGGARPRRRAVVALVTEAGCVPAGQPGPPADPARERVAALPDRRGGVARRRRVRVRARGLRHDRRERRPEPARPPRRCPRVAGGGPVRVAPRGVLHDVGGGHARGHRREVRSGDGRGVPGGRASRP